MPPLRIQKRGCAYFGTPSPKSLFSLAIASVASNMRLYMNDFTILLPVVARDTIELSSFAIFCHKHSSCPLAGVLNIAVNINGNAKVGSQHECCNKHTKTLRNYKRIIKETYLIAFLLTRFPFCTDFTGTSVICKMPYSNNLAIMLVEALLDSFEQISFTHLKETTHNV